MVAQKPKTNAEEISSIGGDVISNFLSYNRTGLINPKDIKLFGFEGKIIKLYDKLETSDEFFSYYYNLAFVKIAQGKHREAKGLFGKALRLRPSYEENDTNYFNVLCINESLTEAKEKLVNFLNKKIEGNLFSLINLFYWSCVDLDFDDFTRLYDLVEEKGLLQGVPKEILVLLNKRVKHLESLKEDLYLIDVDVDTFMTLQKLLFNFHIKKLYDYYDMSFELDVTEDRCLIINVYADVSVKDAIKLTRDFEKVMVDYAVKNDMRRLLSKFLVFYRPLDNIDWDEDAVYTKSEDLMVM